ncbi:MAG: hypothetical protein U9O98_03155 [Asgard group archaeon]|nr:hypothetical protein [Asgard group archaeon]
MKYSLSKKVKKQSLVELFLMLSDSLDEEIPDIVWEGSDFEVDIKQENVTCDISYISTKKGGEFTVKVSWLTPAGKKEKKAEMNQKSKERIKEKKAKVAGRSKSKGYVEEEDIWYEEESELDILDNEDEWLEEDYGDEW